MVLCRKRVPPYKKKVTQINYDQNITKMHALFNCVYSASYNLKNNEHVIKIGYCMSRYRHKRALLAHLLRVDATLLCTV